MKNRAVLTDASPSIRISHVSYFCHPLTGKKWVYSKSNTCRHIFDELSIIRSGEVPPIVVEAVSGPSACE